MRSRSRKKTGRRREHFVRVTVQTVLDGDTFRAKSRVRSIRVAGIDCPELTRQRFFGLGGRKWDPEPLAVAARDYVKVLLEGQVVELNYQGRDVYGRTLARVKFGGQDLAIKVVEEGLGWAAHWSWELLRAQWSAQRLRKGVWGTSQGLWLVAARSPANFLMGTLARLFN